MKNSTFLNLRLATGFLRKTLILFRKSMVKVTAILISFLLLMGKVGTAQPGPEWEVYRTITLDRPTPMANFQVRLVLTAGQYDYIKADGSDIRFYQGTSNIQCSYWIEKWQTTGQSVIWVNVPDVNISSLTMYYGNPAATAVSNGNATFDFFDDFTSLNTAIWSVGPQAAQSGTILTLNANGFVSNKNAFTPPSSTFFMETKHSETQYKRVRYYATTATGSAGTSGGLATTLTSKDYGYFTEDPDLSIGINFWDGEYQNADPKLYAGTSYITQWQIKDDVSPGTMEWSTIDFDNNYDLVSSYTAQIDGQLRFITISTNRNKSDVDWIRLRKSDGNSDISGTWGAVVIKNPPVITSVTSTWCENSIITITGTGLNSALNQVTPVISIGSIPIITNSVNSAGTEITGTLSTIIFPTTGQLSVETPFGIITFGTNYTITPLPTANAGVPLAAICQGGTSEPLGGQVGGGATDGTWSVDVSGGTFNGTTYKTMTWTPPSGFVGTATFTLTTSGGTCGVATPQKSVEVKSVTVQPMTWPALVTCQNVGIPITAPAGYDKYEFRMNGNTFRPADISPVAFTPPNAQNGAIITIVATQTNECKVTYTSDPMQVRPVPKGKFEISEGSGKTNNDGQICIGDQINFLYEAGVAENISGFTYKYILVNDNSTLYSGSSNPYTTSSLVNGSQVKLVVNNQGCEKEFSPKTITVHNLPVAGLTSNPDPVILCDRETATFTATGGDKYEFYVGTALAQSGTNNIYSPSVLANNDEVKVIVEDNNGCKAASSPIIVIVNPLPAKPAITIGGSLTFCSDDAGVPPVLQAPSAAGYQWFKDGTAIAGATGQTYNVIKDATAAGVYTVRVFNANGCESDPANPVTVVVNPPAVKPTITSGGATTFCEGGSVKLTSSLSSVYKWYKDGVEIAGATSREITVNTSGNYTVSVINANGCSSLSSSDAMPVTVNPLPAKPVISASGNKFRFCDEDNTILQADVAGVSYQWYRDGVALTGATGQSYTTLSTLAAAGDYTVTVKDNQGCVSPISDLQAVIVDTLPVPSLSSDDLLICRNSEGSYQTETGNGIHDYVWVINGGSKVSGGGSSDHSVTVHWNDDDDPKSVEIKYKNSFGCEAIKFQPIQTGTNPLPTITTSPAAVHDVCINYPGNVYTTEAGNTNYEWSVTGGTITSGNGTNTATVTWTTAGLQTIKVNYKNSSGCAAAAPTSYNVIVNPLPVADFSYSASVYCSDDINPLPVMSTDPNSQKGVFTSTVGLIINGSTGEVNLAASTPGTYIVTNTVAAAKGCNQVSNTATITITEKPAATISYGNTPFCTSDNSANVVSFTGTKGAYQGGTFSASPSGLSINGSTGEINPSAGTPGTYTITYTIPASGGCQAIPVTTTVEVTELPVPAIAYSANAFCISDATAKYPTLTGTGLVSGGAYSAPAGLSINASTGAITPGASTAGNYTVTYTVPARNGCGQTTATFDVTVTAVPTVSVIYANSPLCNSETSAAVSLTGSGAFSGGTYSSTSGLQIDASSGTINPSASTPGNYTVTYKTPASGGCAAVTTTTTVGITAKPEANAGINIETCADENPRNISYGSTAQNHNGLTWSFTGGDGYISNVTGPLPSVRYNFGTNDKANGAVVTLTLTAAGNGNCAAVSSTKTLTINPLPDAVVITPVNSEFCEGTIQPLSSVKTAVTDYSPVFKASSTPVAIPENNFTGISRDIVVSGIPANAVIKEIVLTLNITHPHDKDLVANLRSASGKEINLFSNVGGIGANFTNTRFSSKAIRPIQTFGSAPFNDEFSPQYVLGAMGAAFATSFSGLYASPSQLNGSWKIKVSDMTGGNTGTLDSCSLTIYYSIPVDPVDVIWSPATDLFMDAAASIPYDGSAVTTVYTKVSQAGTQQYVATTQNDAKGCRNSTQVDVIVREAPSVYIASDYCSEPDKVKLTAVPEGGAPFAYNWNTGASTATVTVDEAHDYYASVTNNYGCVGTAVMSVAKELVTNGDFETGNDGSFYTQYNYVAPGGTLYSEGRYAIDSNANKYHDNFFGKDHTTPAQTGKFMIINGDINTPAKVIWEQTVAVDTATRYYYSAWAMNLNKGGSDSIFAKLQFEVNGMPIGTIADLKVAPKPLSQADVNVNNWVRFYYGSTNGWYSGSNTVATIRIINLEPNAYGNDFGLDDISFATLSPFLRGPEDGSDDQAVCADSEIQTITYQVGTGLTAPDIDNLPPGLTTSYTDGLNFRISGTPVNNTNAPVTYNYTISTKSCQGAASSKSLPGKIVVYPNSKVELASDSATLDQTVCMDQPATAISYNAGGGITGLLSVTGLPAGVSASLNTGEIKIAGSPTESGTFNYTITPQVAPGNSCHTEPISGVMKISPKSKAGELSSSTVCLGESGIIELDDTDQVGEVVTWQISHDGINFTDIPGSEKSSFQNFTNVTQSTTYRVMVKNEYCPDTDSSAPGKVRINNLWEGAVDSQWGKLTNWSAGLVPNALIATCLRTVTIPAVPNTRHEPVINAATSNANVYNLHIQNGGHLSINNGNLKVEGGITNDGGILDARHGGIELNGGTGQTIQPGIFKDNAINDFKISNTSTAGVTLSAPIDVYRSLIFTSGNRTLYTGGNLTLKSTPEETAWVGKLTSGHAINGAVTVERYINSGTNETPTSHRKSWQLLAVPTTGQSIKDSWMEGATQSNITSPAPGSAGNPNPGYGTMTTSDVPNAGNFPTPGFDVYTQPGPSIKAYNSATGRFEGPVSTAVPVYDKRGWMVLVRGDRSVYAYNQAATPTTLRTKGNLFTARSGQTPPSISVAPNQFQSVGNPYASAINLDEVDFTGDVGQFITVWDPNLTGSYGLGGYVTLTKTGAGKYSPTPPSPAYPLSSDNNVIQSGQAFFVQTAGSAGTVGFAEKAKVDGSTLTTFRKGNTASEQFVHLRTNLYGIRNDGSPFIADGTLNMYDPSYDNDLDGLDANKIANTSENLSIRSHGKDLVVERRNGVYSADTIFYKLTGLVTQPYRLEFILNGMSKFGQQAILEDLYTGDRVELNMEGDTYHDFRIDNSAGSKAADRFRIVFREAAGPLATTFVDLQAIKKKADIVVSWTVDDEKDEKLYEVERSTDGVFFNKMATVAARNEGLVSRYGWTDENPAPANYYYRIKKVSSNNKMTLSKVVKVSIRDIQATIEVRPNPIVGGVIQLYFTNQPAGRYIIRLMNPAGQVITSKIVTRTELNSIEKLTWDYTLTHGIYNLEITRPDGSVQVIKVMY